MFFDFSNIMGHIIYNVHVQVIWSGLKHLGKRLKIIDDVITRLVY